MPVVAPSGTQAVVHGFICVEKFFVATVLPTTAGRDAWLLHLFMVLSEPQAQAPLTPRSFPPIPLSENFLHEYQKSSDF